MVMDLKERLKWFRFGKFKNILRSRWRQGASMHAPACVPLYSLSLAWAEARPCAGVQEEVSRHGRLEVLLGYAESNDQQARAPQPHEESQDDQRVRVLGYAQAHGHDPPGDQQQAAQAEQHAAVKRHLRGLCRS